MKRAISSTNTNWDALQQAEDMAYLKDPLRYTPAHSPCRRGSMHTPSYVACAQFTRNVVSPALVPVIRCPLCSWLPDFNQLVGAATNAQRLGGFQDVLPVSALDARDQVGAVIVACVQEVGAGLVERDRVGGGEDADVRHLRRRGTAVAIDR